ncbi:MAG: hypothetical protein J6Y78_11430 [Paludibacteraceae bacterium]|nr:hypothetical protein [Paludibacteraceae bacterium]
MLYNFFLVDNKDGTYHYLLTIYGDGDDDISEESFDGQFDKSDYTGFIDYVESFAQSNEDTYLEIVDVELADKDGYGRFWCDVNNRTYEMEYEDDWNVYVDYKRESGD